MHEVGCIESDGICVTGWNITAIVKHSGRATLCSVLTRGHQKYVAELILTTYKTKGRRFIEQDCILRIDLRVAKTDKKVLNTRVGKKV